MEVTRSCKLVAGGVFYSQGFSVTLSYEDITEFLKASGREPEKLNAFERFRWLSYCAEFMLAESVAVSNLAPPEVVEDWKGLVTHMGSVCA